MPKTSFTVTIDAPEGVTKSELRAYLHEAAVVWADGYDHDSPLIDLKDKDVKVRPSKEAELLRALDEVLGVLESENRSEYEGTSDYKERMERFAPYKALVAKAAKIV